MPPSRAVEQRGTRLAWCCVSEAGGFTYLALRRVLLGLLSCFHLVLQHCHGLCHAPSHASDIRIHLRTHITRQFTRTETRTEPGAVPTESAQSSLQACTQSWHSTYLRLESHEVCVTSTGRVLQLTPQRGYTGPHALQLLHTHRRCLALLPRTHAAAHAVTVSSVHVLQRAHACYAPRHPCCVAGPRWCHSVHQSGPGARQCGAAARHRACEARRLPVQTR